MARIVIIGEGMLELRRSMAASSEWQLGYGGDTLNTAIHLARLGDGVRYFTALGDDAFSEDLRAQWQAEGIDLTLTLTAAGGTPGLYAIKTDGDGERTFSYWRGESAARQMFALPDAAAAAATAADADMLAFSLISLAILPDAGRTALLALAAAMRQAGKCVAFDGNYRPRLWGDAAEVRLWRDRAIACCTIGLPTLEDEILMGDDASATRTAARWRAGGAGEVVVKLGEEGCVLSDGTIVPPPARLRPVDTSGAGDAFNAAYLHARALGVAPASAALAGHRLAGWVVMRSGAVPPIDDAQVYAG
ncbi:MAG: sugar kinase [Sphingomonas bacterium]|nr:sugar kinase [Sphingomonas bacterium]